MLGVGCLAVALGLPGGGLAAAGGKLNAADGMRRGHYLGMAA